MDKSTLSNYGWVVIAVLVLSVMIALATPFGRYIATAVENTTQGLFDVQQKALSAADIEIMQQEFDVPNGNSGAGENIGSGETPSEPEQEEPKEYTLSGTWVFNDTLKCNVSVSANINYTSSLSTGIKHLYMEVNKDGNSIDVIYGGNGMILGPVDVYWDGWDDDSYKTIDLGSTPQTVSKEFYNWFTENATRIG